MSFSFDPRKLFSKGVDKVKTVVGLKKGFKDFFIAGIKERRQILAI